MRKEIITCDICAQETSDNESFIVSVTSVMMKIITAKDAPTMKNPGHLEIEICTTCFNTNFRAFFLKKPE